MKTILLLSIFSLSIFPQSSKSGIQQITNVDGDARNVFIPNNPYLNINPNIFFEIHKDSISNIVSIYYDQGSDKFSEPNYITHDSSLNINPKYIQFPDYTDYKGFLFFQTNRNGNWQIGYKIRRDSVWSKTKLIDSSTVDETNPTLFLRNPYLYADTLSPRILYEENNSIYMAFYRDSSFVVNEVFEGSDSVSYSQPTGVLPEPYFTGDNYYVAARKIIENKSSIVYKTMSDTGTQWSSEQIVVDSGNCSNPQFFYYGNSVALAYENSLGRYSNIYFLLYWSLADYPTIRDSLLDSLKGNLSELRIVLTPPLITKQIKKNNYNLYTSHAYKYLIGDSAFVDVMTDYVSSGYYHPDTLVHTSVKNTSLAISFMQIGSDNIFTAWEDSVNGHIQLFGAGYYMSLGAIKDGNTPASFQLYQNYPNPFNPSTKIKFYLPHNGFVKLTIYNILGKKIKELINNYMYSGNHEVNFNAGALGLASGIYIYQLKAENKVTAKKMILLK